MKRIPKDGGPTASKMMCGESVMVPVGGLSKREYFAAMAVQGILANPSSGKQCIAICGEPSASRAAVEISDALLEALSKEVKP